MAHIDNKRPSKLYYFSEKKALERTLALGEFKLTPPLMSLPTPANLNNAESYLTLSLTQSWDGTLFDANASVDAYIVIHDVEEFGERMHRAAQKSLPNWAGIDAAISYGAPSPLGKLFSKAKNYAHENEWRFAWRPIQARVSANPVVIKIGSLADIAELHVKDH
tara:strand:+ start:5536 stop:6027 length:492 start_codon:yes stop_codon:yes gene_type:complete